MRILGVVSSSSREVPNAPTIGTATDVGTSRAFNNGAATVTFTAPTWTGGLPITGYTVTSSPGGFTGTGSASPITVTGLQSNTNYTFTVRATNAVGQSSASAASNSILATTVPQAPTIGTATAGNASATVAYTANATGGKTVTYTATSSPGGFTGTGASPITVSGLTNGTPYTFTVTATNANGSATSAASNSVTPVSPVVSFWTVAASGSDRFVGSAVNSDGIYFSGLASSAIATTSAQMFRFSKSNGTVVWQKAIANPTSGANSYTQAFDCAVDTAGNVYNCGTFTNSSGQPFGYLNKYNSSGTMQWQRTFSVTGNNNANTARAIYIDSSNNIHLTSIMGVIYKFDSNGTLLWSRNVPVNGGDQPYSYTNIFANSTYVATVVPSYLVVGKYGESVAYTTVTLSNTSGANVRTVTLGDGSVGWQWVGWSVLMDTSNSTYVTGQRLYFSNFPSILKLNTSLNRITSTLFGGFNGPWTGSCIDSSNNIYVAGTNFGLFGSAIWVAKYDSNLNLQWQRVITSNSGAGGGDFHRPRINLDATNNRLAISSRIAGSRAFGMFLPADGSGTGSYNVGGITVTYAVGSGSVQSQNDNTNGQPGTNSTITPTVTAQNFTETTPALSFSTTTF